MMRIGIQMVKFVNKMKIVNFKNLSKSMKIEATINISATISALSMDLTQKLWLKKVDAQPQNVTCHCPINRRLE